ncbi:class I SAM-dependent methyltransferase [Laspinema palackyanum]|uniref:class I SAM-dependent methyltransferase n=1 Tax=Laspinema palackyanum TaxID=3231601 RepID=UPI00345CF9FE|nr:class I SAM-dependent methyltransferase [Laspinema sp. D2c]
MVNIHQLYAPFLRHFRRGRLQRFYARFEVEEATRVIDVGGDQFFWELAKEEGFPVPQVTVINLYENSTTLPENISWVVADGKNIPFEDSAFDIAFSNSVIEHLETWENQVQFASEIQRVAPNFFVQTPSYNFPVEPHFLTPFIHWLPKSIQHKVVRNFTVWGLVTRPTAEYCKNMVSELRLLTQKEMAILFPDSNLEIEQSLGLEKSLLAIGKRK